MKHVSVCQDDRTVKPQSKSTPTSLDLSESKFPSRRNLLGAMALSFVTCACAHQYERDDIIESFDARIEILKERASRENSNTRPPNNGVSLLGESHGEQESTAESSGNSTQFEIDILEELRRETLQGGTKDQEIDSPRDNKDSLQVPSWIDPGLNESKNYPLDESTGSFNPPATGSVNEKIADNSESDSPQDEYRTYLRQNINRIHGFAEGAVNNSIERIAHLANKNGVKLRLLYGDERKAIRAARKNLYSPYIGLALSGGGIRSASFSTGVLQGLHELGILEDIGYLSTVSGGGEAAMWYMTHTVSDDEGLFRPGSPYLQHLASQGHYLVAGHSSQGLNELVFNIALHTLLTPIHWFANGLFDWDLNVPAMDDFYKDGIERAYADPPYNVGAPETAPAEMSMHELLPSTSFLRPFWIINMHLSLADDNKQFKNRSGDGFELDPLRAGADAVGYVKTPRGDLLDAPRSTHWMNPVDGVTISAAAVDSKSLRTSAIVSTVLQVGNYDLGTFIDSWAEGFVVDKDHTSLDVLGRNLQFYLTSPAPINLVLGRIPYVDKIIEPEIHGETLQAKRFYLSDGGHFENLGVYALVRRGCRLIVVSDATYDEKVTQWQTLSNRDKAFCFDDLHKLEELLLADFGADLRMEWKNFSVPDASIFIGHIRNLPIHIKDELESDRTQSVSAQLPEVTFIYIKAAYVPTDDSLSENPVIASEYARNRDFPQESTARQFYGEERVLAYRELGRQSVHRAATIFRDEISKLKAQIAAGEKPNLRDRNNPFIIRFK